MLNIICFIIGLCITGGLTKIAENGILKEVPK